MLGLGSAPVQAVTHPAAGVASRALPTPNATHTQWNGLVPHMYVDGKMTPDQAQATVENAFNTALQGVRPATVRAPIQATVNPLSGGSAPRAAGVDLAAARAESAAQTPVPGRNLNEQTRAVAPQMPVAQAAPTADRVVAKLAADKKAAYAKVDSSGFTFPSADVTALADNLDAAVRAKGGPAAAQASPQADSLIGRVRALASQPGGATLSQLDQVRSDIWPLMMEDGGRDAAYGKLLRDGIDGLINGASAPFIQEARAANTRWAKADEVSRRVQSAQLQAGRSNSGENLGNAIRQKLSPMIDPMHSAEVQNLTPTERNMLAQIVMGDPTQNKLRTWGNRLRNPMWTGTATTPAALAGFMGGGPVGGATAAGLTAAAMQGVGQGLRAAAENRTMTNVNKLLDIIAQNGPPAPKAPVVTPRRAVGAGAVAAPAARRQAPAKKP